MDRAESLRLAREYVALRRAQTYIDAVAKGIEAAVAEAEKGWEGLQDRLDSIVMESGMEPIDLILLAAEDAPEAQKPEET